MLIKCPNCSGALEYDPAMNQMSCSFCGNSFNVTDFEDGIYIGSGEGKAYKKQEDVENTISKEKFRENEFSQSGNPFWNPKFKTVVSKEGVKMEQVDLDLEPEYEEGMIEYRIYTCTSCGAELTVNEVESSTFCAYCGQPTIVFSRVTKALKPDYIIPFVITKERASQIVKQRFSRGLFVPKSLKKLDVKLLRGIYIPYWVVDMNYETYQVWRGTVSDGQNISTEFFDRSADVDFKDFMIEASKNLNDNISDWLDYDLRPKKPFEIGYLQGFYTDRFDLNSKELNGMIRKKAGKIVNEQIKSTFSASDLELVKDDVKIELKKKKYFLLPAWFLTYRHEGVSHTILVNGQNGAPVGGIPFEKWKVILFSVLISLGIFPFMFLLLYIMGRFVNYLTGAAFVLYIVLALPFIVIILVSLGNFRKAYEIAAQTKEADVNLFTRERQDRDEFYSK